MDADKVNIYGPCDRVIQYMNRWNLREFGKLKVAKWDELNIIRTVTELYKRSTQQARKQYFEEAFEVYLLLLETCDIRCRKANGMAEKAITSEWVDRKLNEVDPVTEFKYQAEAERKAYRLAEAMEVTQDRDYEINKALRYWSQQQGQYAINFTDYAVYEALKDAGVEMVEWVSRRDSRVCNECHAYDGQIFRLDEVPAKHWGCRCTLRPVFRT